jgi:N-acetylglucosaminyl-diphospho-decaprenol L-rhamnosyltransferase
MSGQAAGDRAASICVVIVNYRTRRLTMDCVESLKGQLDPASCRIVVVDNASGPGEVEAMRKAIADTGLERLVTLLALDENRGFSAGNNAGIRSLEADYYLLANSDTVFLPEAVRLMKEAFSLRPEVGIVSPRLEWPDGEAQVSCFRRQAPLSEMIRSAETGPLTALLRAFDVPLRPIDRPSRPDWTSFACVMISAGAMAEVGPLDEGYFMYFEDSDYCRRARAAGYDILNWPRARVIHLQGRSSDVDERLRLKKRLPDYYYRSRARYYRKYYGMAGYLVANASWLIGRMISLVREVIAGRPRSISEGEARGIWIADVPHDRPRGGRSS